MTNKQISRKIFQCLKILLLVEILCTIVNLPQKAIIECLGWNPQWGSFVYLAVGQIVFGLVMRVVMTREEGVLPAQSLGETEKAINSPEIILDIEKGTGRIEL